MVKYLVYEQFITSYYDWQIKIYLENFKLTSEVDYVLLELLTI